LIKKCNLRRFKIQQKLIWTLMKLQNLNKDGIKQMIFVSSEYKIGEKIVLVAQPSCQGSSDLMIKVSFIT
jgi:hypothetical protein